MVYQRQPLLNYVTICLEIGAGRSVIDEMHDESGRPAMKNGTPVPSGTV